MDDFEQFRLNDARVGHVVELLDSFVHQGPNGTHACSVFELLGPTVDDVVSNYRDGAEPGEEDSLEPATILKITGQLLRALSAMHAAGYAHGGSFSLCSFPILKAVIVLTVISIDISGANLAFTTHNLQELSVEEMFEVIGAPFTEQLARRDRGTVHPSMPEQLVQKTGWDMWIDEDEEDVCLIDFGESFVHGAEPYQLAEPPGLEVPERIFTGKFDYRVDLWRAGCLIYTLLFGSRPFQSLGDVDAVVAQMMHFVEGLPTAWRPQWEARRHSSELALPDPDEWEGPSELEIKFNTQVKDTSLQRLLPIIQGLMRFQPEMRISAEQALRMLDG
ncbi:kinase-like domain-containing protein [Chaetomium sp. MPI-SDFR-AT-0129]|nr:kinase-like domain-containing protein [Chaetomium sp. MPI-SDFR-AT-0129]